MTVMRSTISTSEVHAGPDEVGIQMSSSAQPLPPLRARSSVADGVPQLGRAMSKKLSRRISGITGGERGEGESLFTSTDACTESVLEVGGKG